MNRLCALLLLPSLTFADELYLTTVGVSTHFSNNQELNEIHPGVGVEHWFRTNDKVVLMAHSFVDSYNYRSYVVGMGRSIWEYHGVKLVGSMVVIHKKVLSSEEPTPVTFVSPFPFIQAPLFKRIYSNISIVPTTGDYGGLIFLLLKVKI